MDPSVILQLNRKAIISIAESHGARNVRVFGSLARGEASPDSDIDLLVELEQDRSLLDIIAIKQEIEDLIHCKVDVVTEAALSPYIRQDILQEAVSL